MSDLEKRTTTALELAKAVLGKAGHTLEIRTVDGEFCVFDGDTNRGCRATSAEAEALRERLTRAVKVVGSRATLDKLFPQDGDPEAGVHVHTLDRTSEKTMEDGRHLHLFLIEGDLAQTLFGEDRVLLITDEDGEHAHGLGSANAERTMTDGAHDHGVPLPNGETVRTGSSASPHDHGLLVATTAFDGMHGHTLMIEGMDEPITSLTGAQFWEMIDGPDQSDNPPSPPASELTKDGEEEIDKQIHAFVLEPDAEALLDMDDDEIKSIDMRLHALFGRLFANKEQDEDEGVTREQTVFAHLLILQTMADREIPHETDDELMEASKREKSNDDGVSDDDTDKITLRMLKQDTADDSGGVKEERYVLGVVLEPDEVDAQDDTYSPEEVRAAAHSFMEFFGGKIKVMHKGRPVDGVKVLETYITKAEERHGDGVVIKVGTWMLAVRVQDDELWEAVLAGDFTGFSIGGTAIRERLKSIKKGRKGDWFPPVTA